MEEIPPGHQGHGDPVNVTEGNNNTVHIAYLGADDKVAGTQCNRELFTINHRRRVFYRDNREATCKRCLTTTH